MGRTSTRTAWPQAVRNIEHHWIEHSRVNTDNLSGRVFESVFNDGVIEAIRKALK